MASMLIRKIDERTKARLRVRAAEHGRSMEEEARAILARELRPKARSKLNIYAAIRSCFEPLGGVDLDIPPRAPLRDPPDFR